MNGIQEYRKVSVVKLGIKHHILSQFKSQIIIVKINGGWVEWHPDIDLNQMGMIEDQLIEQGCTILTRRHKKYSRVSMHGCPNPNKLGVVDCESENKSKPIAFMKAFMKYVKEMKSKDDRQM